MARAHRHKDRRPRRRGREKPRRALRTTLAVGLSLAVLTGAGAGWAYLRLGNNIDTFGADGLSDHRPSSAALGQNVLVIGSDSRSGENSSLGGGQGEVGRSDTAFLLHVYADGKHAVAVSIPRDTLVEIPACKLPDGSWTEPREQAMFNAAFSVGETPEGNPACTQNTVEKLTGLRVDHTVVVDFQGFAALTEAVGGVRICLPADIHQGDLDPNRTTPGKRVFRKGVQEVQGQAALDYVRLRHGVGDGSDIGRIKRQQAFVGALVKKVREDGLTPTRLLPLADAATRSLTVDPGLGSADRLISFAMSLKNVELDDTRFVTVPWRYEGARVAVVQPEADALWAALRADRPLEEKGKEEEGEGEEAVDGVGIAVAVANGTTVTGLAARAAEALSAHGFTVTGTSTAPEQGGPTTVVHHGPGDREAAATVARLFPGAKLAASPDPGVRVTVGQEYADTPSPGPSPKPSRAPGEDARSAADDICSDLSYG
ncbi:MULTISPECIES: LCP family protein [Streptomyces]|uniref:LCP family protein n=1 Tax=Streptomyces odorifer TaxID=53450 RepID=A0A7Y6F4J2_9ACTN|nr:MULTISPECIES: LCP family protein [Streptomyces]NUV37318.1 LCP family protein [Streptomyces sp. KAI-27]NUV50435.1 LCP family protein [Streptomyces sp. CAI-78]MBL0780827.1 LCP family protein [Streptomyces albidoflavus]MBL0799641.1 LCP family protein [Streptomyces albidoflavus]MBV1953457.1 LCP family protein [Streptomyces sp. BV333]